MTEETLDSQSNEGVQITDQMVQDLKATAPWMKFLGILYLIFSSLAAISALFLVAQAVSVGGFHISLIIMLAGIALAIYLATLVLKMGNQYSNFALTLSSVNLEKAFSAQKRFWIISGIIIVLYLLLLIIGYSYFAEFAQNDPNFYR